MSPAATASAASARADALDGVGRSFKATLAAVRRLRGRDTHRPERLSHAQYSVLFELARNQPRSLRDLALDADLSAATVTQMLDAMAADGLVERVRCEHDKRVVLTSLTTRGEALVAERRALYEPLWREALERFSDDELLTAAAVLESLGEMFGELGS